MAVHDQFEVVIPSTTEAGQELLDRIVGKIETIESFSPRDAFGIRLALDEAIRRRQITHEHNSKLMDVVVSKKAHQKQFFDGAFAVLIVGIKLFGKAYRLPCGGLLK